MPNTIFEEQFLDIIEKNHNENVTLIDQYQACYHEVLKEVKEKINDLRKINVHYSKFKNRGEIKHLFDEVEMDYMQRTGELQEEYFDEIINSYDGVDKRTKMLLLDNDVKQKQIYQLAEKQDDVIIQKVKDKSKVSLELANTDEIVEDIYIGSSKIIKSHFLKIRFVVIFLPIILFIISIGMAIAQILNGTKDIEANIDQDNLETVIELGSKLLEVFGKGSESIVGGFSIASAFEVMFVIGVVWFFIYKFVVFVNKNKLINKLEICVGEHLDKYITQIDNNRMKFSEDIENRLKEADKIYMSKYIDLFKQIN